MTKKKVIPLNECKEDELYNRVSVTKIKFVDLRTDQEYYIESSDCYWGDELIGSIIHQIHRCNDRWYK